MTRTRCAALCFLLLALAAPGITREDLSPEARKLLPEEDRVTVRMKDGSEITGIVLEEDDLHILLRAERNRIAFERSLARADIAERRENDVVHLVFERLRVIAEKTTRALDPAEYDRLIALADELLAKAPEHADAGALGGLRAVWADAKHNVELGMQLVDGAWLGPVQAALRRFDEAEEKLQALQKRFSRIERPDYSGSPRAKALYDQLATARREIARALPKEIGDRLPVLIDDGRFDEAADVVSDFTRFWVRRVMRAEKTPGRDEDDAFQGMDLGYLGRLQTRVLDAYRAAGLGQDAAPEGLDAGPDMVFVPGGYFLMGDATSGPDSDVFPVHLAHTEPFLIDRREVTNAEYRRFVEHVKATGDSSMEHPDAPPLKDHVPEGWQFPELSADDQPVVGVDWFDAYAYAKWVGKRLPSETEWEKAARGMDAHRYPWGDDPPERRPVNSPSGRSFVLALIRRAMPPPPAPPPKRSWFGRKEEPPPPPPEPTLPAVPWEAAEELPALARFHHVKAEPSALSPYGLLHMAGNAAEWVGDAYEAQAYRVLPVRRGTEAGGGLDHVFRGGSYLDEDEALCAFARAHPGTDPRRRKGLADRGRPIVGFRCAKSVVP